MLQLTDICASDSVFYGIEVPKIKLSVNYIIAQKAEEICFFCAFQNYGCIFSWIKVYRARMLAFFI